LAVFQALPLVTKLLPIFHHGARLLPVYLGEARNRWEYVTVPQQPLKPMQENDMAIDLTNAPRFSPCYGGNGPPNADNPIAEYLI
jgi:hypothetical protein